MSSIFSRRLAAGLSLGIAAGLGLFSPTFVQARPKPRPPEPSKLPNYKHIVIVVEENKDYDQVMFPEKKSFLKDVLADGGAVLTEVYGEEHPSQGNYFWLFSGSDQGVGFNDEVPGNEKSIGPLTTKNLAQQLIKHGRTFKGYCESLPAAGFTGNYFPAPQDGAGLTPRERMKGVLYGRKHVPWVSFANVSPKDHQASIHRPFTDFPQGHFDDLPTVAFVIPNLENDMHNGEPPESVTKGDAWLGENLSKYAEWALTHDSLLIVTWDECDDIEGYSGLTNPSVAPLTGVEAVDKVKEAENSNYHRLRHDLLNHISTIFYGAHIKPGFYKEGRGITHVNMLRTLEAMYGLEKSGAQQPNAEGWGIKDDYIITDIFTP